MCACVCGSVCLYVCACACVRVCVARPRVRFACMAGACACLRRAWVGRVAASESESRLCTRAQLRRPVTQTKRLRASDSSESSESSESPALLRSRVSLHSDEGERERELARGLSFLVVAFIVLCLSVCLSVFLSVFLSFCLSVCLSVCRSLTHKHARARGRDGEERTGSEVGLGEGEGRREGGWPCLEGPSLLTALEERECLPRAPPLFAWSQGGLGRAPGCLCACLGLRVNRGVCVYRCSRLSSIGVFARAKLLVSARA